MYSVSTKTGKCKHLMVRHNRQTIIQTSDEGYHIERHFTIMFMKQFIIRIHLGHRIDLEGPKRRLRG